MSLKLILLKFGTGYSLLTICSRILTALKCTAEKSTLSGVVVWWGVAVAYSW